MKLGNQIPQNSDVIQMGSFLSALLLHCSKPNTSKEQDLSIDPKQSQLLTAGYLQPNVG